MLFLVLLLHLGSEGVSGIQGSWHLETLFVWPGFTILGLGLTLGPQDLKDFARKSALDVVYSEIGRDRDGKGYVLPNVQTMMAIH